MRIKTFYGTTENAIKTQIWIDFSVYLLVAIIKNRLHLDKSLYNILQVMSVSVFENMRLIQLLDFSEIKPVEPAMPIQLNLFDNLMGTSDIIYFRKLDKLNFNG